MPQLDTPFGVYTGFDFDEWIAYDDQHTCHTCASLAGSIFPAGKGPQPPLHPHCRCRRVHHHTAYAPASPRDVGSQRSGRP